MLLVTLFIVDEVCPLASCYAASYPVHLYSLRGEPQVEPRGGGTTLLLCRILSAPFWEGDYHRHLADGVPLRLAIHNILGRKLKVCLCLFAPQSAPRLRLRAAPEHPSVPSQAHREAILPPLAKHGEDVVLQGRRAMKDFERCIEVELHKDPVLACARLRRFPEYITATGVAYFVM